jgi:DNA-binding NarL/FixJ family response regulator
MLEEGLNIREIAARRGLQESTVYGRLHHILVS